MNLDNVSKDRDNNLAHLERAVVAYRAALEGLSRERSPLDWAAAQDSLGSALFRLGEAENGTARLEEAILAYGAALKEYTLDRAPLQWAATQNNLGNALFRLGERQSRTSCLEEAILAYREALKQYTPESTPLEWAVTQSNLGNALFKLGIRHGLIAQIEEAVAVYRAALKEFTRERAPREFVAIQNNLASALVWLGERDRKTVLPDDNTTDRAALFDEAAMALNTTLLDASNPLSPRIFSTAMPERPRNIGHPLKTAQQFFISRAGAQRARQCNLAHTRARRLHHHLAGLGFRRKEFHRAHA